MREEGGGRREELIEFLESKRWFGDKGREIREARVRDFVPVEWPNSQKPFAVARVDVRTDQGISTYQLFAPAAAGAPTTHIDALDDPEFRRGLADAWLRGVSFERDGVSWILESEGTAPLVVPPTAPITVSSAEQTNSSVILNREAILKLFRRIEPGVHPDVEITRFLTLERRFVHVPVLLGTVRFQDASGITIAGMLQEYVQGATDGWTFALERLRAEHSRGGGDTKHQEGNRPFEKDAEELGIVVRALHETLASGDQGSDFDLRPATQDDVRRWQQSAVRTMEAGLSMLERGLASKTLPRATAEAANSILERRSRYAAAITALTADIGTDAGANTRTHGDLHLGQVLRSAAAQFLVIDFEGEPTRPLRERRARSSPLRDVAGMLRSFAYAAAAGSKKRNESAERWETDACRAFLRCYHAETKGRAGLLPRSRANADRLVRLFETEKAFYELQYELAHRPDWVWIPLRALTRLFE